MVGRTSIVTQATYLTHKEIGQYQVIGLENTIKDIMLNANPITHNAKPACARFLSGLFINIVITASIMPARLIGKPK